MACIDVLLPTCDRPEALALTLAGIANQTCTDLRVIVADQSARPPLERPTIAALKRILEARLEDVEWHYRSERRGIAEQREFLFSRAQAPAVLYLDDDVLMEPWVVAALHDALLTQNCGFVGAFPAGLSYINDVRPTQQAVEFWDGPVLPEAIEPDSRAWQRYHLHRAANLYHATQRHGAGRRRLYKVAWVASCILYDRDKLRAVGGFSFWPRLPRFHSGEEVLVQNLLLRRYGGCAMMPSGTYHAEEPSTVLNASGGVDGHALALLPEMIARYCPEPMYA